MFTLKILVRFAAVAMVCVLSCVQAQVGSPFALRHGDKIAFVGGSDVAADQFAGHLETVLTINAGTNRVLFRNFGWEGDTVFEQPRDFGYPALVDRLKKEAPTKVFLQYGRAECLVGTKSAAEFKTAYSRLLDNLAPLGSEIILVTPPPFQQGSNLRPNLSLRNVELAAFATAIRELAAHRNLRVLDLFLGLGGVAPAEPFTSDGLNISPKGHAMLAMTAAKSLGLKQSKSFNADANGRFTDLHLEKLRQTILQKNRLWFDYSRPQNWAFLGGDRVTQPSSRDHKDPNVRWFPKEMEKFVPLIAAKENEIQSLIKEVR